MSYLKDARKCNPTMYLEVGSWKCTPLCRLGDTMVIIQNSYWMAPTGLFLAHTVCHLWVGCVSASHLLH